MIIYKKAKVCDHNQHICGALYKNICVKPWAQLPVLPATGVYGGDRALFEKNREGQASVTHGSRISLGGSRQLKKAISQPQNLLVMHPKPLRVVCGGQIRPRRSTAKIAVR